MLNKEQVQKIYDELDECNDALVAQAKQITPSVLALREVIDKLRTVRARVSSLQLVEDNRMFFSKDGD